jgi:CelD/BcsL family acetyltransferase involved in cellulose biosynthesis
MIRAVAEARSIDPIADPAWADLLTANPSASVFHHPAWLRLLRDQYGYSLQALCVEEDGAIAAAVPIARIESRLTGQRLVALPFSDVCPPVLGPGAGPSALVALGTALAAERQRSGLEITLHGPLPDPPDAFVQHRFHRHLLELSDDPVEVESRYSKSQIKRGIKKARREGLQVERRTDVAALDTFYALHLRTRRKLGAPTQPKRFIRRFAELFDEGLGFVELVLDAERPIAAAVFLTHQGMLTYKYGASDERSLGKRPNNLLFAEAIRWACESGFHTLDFGRTDLDNEGLRSFKRSWGAEEEELSYTYFTEREPSPEPQLRDRLMSATIRRSPRTVGRLIGETLYGHFG